MALRTRQTFMMVQIFHYRMFWNVLMLIKFITSSWGIIDYKICSTMPRNRNHCSKGAISVSKLVSLLGPCICPFFRQQVSSRGSSLVLSSLTLLPPACLLSHAWCCHWQLGGRAGMPPITLPKELNTCVRKEQAYIYLFSVTFQFWFVCFGFEFWEMGDMIPLPSGVW